jgi:hypothetical protein
MKNESFEYLGNVLLHLRPHPSPHDDASALHPQILLLLQKLLLVLLLLLIDHLLPGLLLLLLHLHGVHLLLSRHHDLRSDLLTLGPLGTLPLLHLQLANVDVDAADLERLRLILCTL